jgi:DNA-binding response OmpR family regulator
LILLDVVMPKQDGFWGEKQGAAALIAKPFSPDEMASVIREFV